LGSIRDYLRDVRKRYKIRREKQPFWFFPESRFGYLQINKVASRSIREALFNTEGLRRDGETFEEFAARYYMHVPLGQVRAMKGDGLVFAFVRHPLARLYSSYVNKLVDQERRGRRNIFSCNDIPFGISFEEFVERVCALPDRECERHIRSQAWFLSDAEGVVPTFLGKMETFNDDWERLRQSLPFLGTVRHINRGSHCQDYRQFYTPRMVQLAQSRFERDFKLFGYDLD
jgi:dermatan 4-sulfotransferase 1